MENPPCSTPLLELLHANNIQDAATLACMEAEDVCDILSLQGKPDLWGEVPHLLAWARAREKQYLRKLALEPISTSQRQPAVSIPSTTLGSAPVEFPSQSKGRSCFPPLKKQRGFGHVPGLKSGVVSQAAVLWNW